MPRPPPSGTELPFELPFGDLLEALPDALVIVDGDGRIVLANAQTQALLGYARQELLGQPVEMLVAARLRDRHAGHRRGFFALPSERTMGATLELYALHRDGRELAVEISLSPLHSADGMLVSAAIRDVSDRRRSERAAAHLVAIVDSSQDAIIGKTLMGGSRAGIRPPC